MANEQVIIESLSPIERKVLPVLNVSKLELNEISQKAEVDETTAQRALEFLKNKKLIEVIEEEGAVVQAGVNGLFYLKKQLPERRLLNKLAEKKVILIHEMKNVCGLNDNESKVAIGVLKKKVLVNLSNGRIMLVGGKEEISKKMIEELFLEKLPVGLSQLKDEDKLALDNLKARKDIVEVVNDKKVSAKLSKLGDKISKMNLKVDLIEQLTPKLLKGNGWKGKKFRRYDLQTSGRRVYGGKRHFVNQATDYAKKIWLEMGFKEMAGSLVQTSFWNFDALFTAQDHPVREMQDTFFIAGVEGKLPEEGIVQGVGRVHEGGAEMAGGVSRGWQSEWKEENAKKVLLRTHTTCLSAKTLQKIADDVKEGKSAKYFALGKCFRNETVDWSHGFEFNQTEGIVVDEDANFRQLLGYLVEFFKKMGYDKIRIRPGYFPYTEPSLEIDVFHPEKKKWLELGGAGMFRPEVTVPMFGKHIPVLAWGPGFDRTIMEFFEIKDLREMYKNDLAKLREMGVWLK
ncbi:phenylalanine--tRNA ligase subunit alpha [Candidatus Pacearchaeota archaeon]|nr:phenylalanine--tRNA ligase subunit alpha [Candidatus Pacearchaeota archaeon]